MKTYEHAFTACFCLHSEGLKRRLKAKVVQAPRTHAESRPIRPFGTHNHSNAQLSGTFPVGSMGLSED